MSEAAPAATLVDGFELLIPPGEQVLWTGSPDSGTWLRRSWFLRAIWLWVGAVLLVQLVRQGASMPGQQLVWLGLIAAFGTACVVLTDIWICRTTRYLITDRRIAMRIGLTLPGTANIPFERLDSAAVRRFGDGSGDIALRPEGPLGVGFFVLWPHTRAWRLSHPEPTLRALADVDEVASILRSVTGRS